MTDDDLQGYCNEIVRLKYAGRILTGKLICGSEAQLTVRMPYAIETKRQNATRGTFDTHLDGIAGPEGVESVEIVDEPVNEEIEEAAKDAQTPG